MMGKCQCVHDDDEKKNSSKETPLASEHRRRWRASHTAEQETVCGVSGRELGIRIVPSKPVRSSLTWFLHDAVHLSFNSIHKNWSHSLFIPCESSWDSIAMTQTQWIHFQPFSCGSPALFWRSDPIGSLFAAQFDALRECKVFESSEARFYIIIYSTTWLNDHRRKYCNRSILHSTGDTFFVFISVFTERSWKSSAVNVSEIKRTKKFFIQCRGVGWELDWIGMGHNELTTQLRYRWYGGKLTRSFVALNMKCLLISQTSQAKSISCRSIDSSTWTVPCRTSHHPNSPTIRHRLSSPRRYTFSSFPRYTFFFLLHRSLLLKWSAPSFEWSKRSELQ